MPTYWCTAMYAVGRSYAVESIASSGATTRSSIGNPIGSRRRSIRASTRSSASAARSRGMAYSISVKRTSRVFAYTRLLASRCSDRLISPASRRLSTGSAAGSARPAGRTARAPRSRGPRRGRRPPRGRAAGRRVGALGGERERPARVGHHERLPVVVRVHQLVEPREHVVERARLVDAVNGEGGHAAERDRARSRRARRGSRGRRAARRPRGGPPTRPRRSPGARP